MGLTGDLRRLLFMNAISFVIFIYIGIFVNLYIWEQGHRIFDVTWFNLILFMTWPFAFTYGAKLLSRYSIRLLLTSSAVFAGIAFLILSLLQLEQRLLWITLIGIPVGMMWGLFAAAQNLTISLVAKGQEFAQFFAASSIIAQVLSMTVPLFSAQVIHYFGYSSSFVLMLVFISVMIAVARRVPPISLRPLLKGPDTWMSQMHWRKIIANKGAKWILLSSMAAGFFLQFQGLFALVFTFSLTDSTILISVLNVTYTLSSILALFIYRRLKRSEGTWLWMGIIFLAIGFTIILIPFKPMLFISNILTTVGMFYFALIFNSQQFRMINTYTPIQQACFLAWREGMLCLTRCLMLLMILSVKSLQGSIFIALIVFSLICLLTIPYFQHKIKQTDEEKQLKLDSLALNPASGEFANESS